MITITERNGQLFITIPRLYAIELPLEPIDSVVYEGYGTINNFWLFRNVCEKRLKQLKLTCQDVSKFASCLWKDVPNHVKITLKEYSKKIAKAKPKTLKFKPYDHSKSSKCRPPKKIKNKPIETNSVEFAVITTMLLKRHADDLWIHQENQTEKPL
ncbi:7889_t:CDS:2 [Funneliformis mosseae]|uniref:7889_t:CDS:1 n=1 Tax=Funneliformis mosseae TaxID=27381 RepID=A0A9N8YMN3_FUNMO|nr:7889_t:CDS:2 [Funneliformis mosseae]